MNTSTPYDASALLAIGLPANPVEELVAWYPEKHSLFTVSTAYRFGLQCAHIFSLKRKAKAMEQVMGAEKVGTVSGMQTSQRR
jgi:hypothetical protein